MKIPLQQSQAIARLLRIVDAYNPKCPTIGPGFANELKEAIEGVQALNLDPQNVEELYTEAQLEEIGNDLAMSLVLRPDPEHPDRWRTNWGSKTNAGLARMLIYNIFPKIAAGDMKAAKA